MKISRQEKKKIESLLMKWGEKKEDLPQIFRGKVRARFYLDDNEKGIRNKKISCDDAYKLLGYREFWSGIHRASFHFTAYRHSLDGTKGVYIDCSALFRN